MIVRLPSICFLLALTARWVFAQSAPPEENRPPSIIKNPPRRLYYIKKEQIDLGCIATADTKPQYIWLKDGKELNLTLPENVNRMTLKSGVGSLVINPSTETDAGVYQCKAVNNYGTSLSVRSNVLQAIMIPFKTVVEPEKKKPLLGYSLKLVCEPPESYPPAKLSWVLNAMKSDDDVDEDDSDDGFNSVTLNDRITMDYKGNLYFTNVKPEDAQNGQKYVCMAYNDKVRSYNQGEDKLVEPIGNAPANMPVEIMWHSEKIILTLLAKTVRLKCIFSGSPQPSIEWRRVDNKPLDASRMEQSSDGFELEIKNIQYDDKGQYECQGLNPQTPIPRTVTFTLSVESRPYWIKEPKDQEVGVEEGAVFSCKADGIPKPTIQWFINGEPYESAKSNKNRELKNKVLYFTNLQKADSLVIQCNASNKHGYLWADVYLHVLAIPAKVIKKPSAEQKVASEQAVTLKCESVGKPTPEVRWFKGAQQLSDGGRHKIQPNGDLLIKNVNIKDSGNYRCYVKNKFGRDSANGTLMVRRKTRIDSPPIDQEVIHGNEVTFTCGASTDPNESHNLHYAWTKNGQPLATSDPRIQQNEGDLVINDVKSSDTANYTCVASNNLDNATSSAVLRIKAPPDAPADVKIQECFAKAATVIWEFSESLQNFSPLQNFIVEYNTTYKPNKWIIVSRPRKNARRAKIKLSPFALYTFRVKAVNKIGIGKASNITSPVCRTPQSRPDRNPRKVGSIGDRTKYLIVEWEPMSKIDHNGEDFKYEIIVQELGSNGNGVLRYIEDDYTVGRKEIPVNTIYKPYRITVKAKNRIGEPLKKPKAVIGYSGEAAPIVVPENFELDPDYNVTATSAHFRWDPVDTSEEKIRGKFSGYKVRFWKADQEETTRHEILIPHEEPVSGSRRRRAADGKIRAAVQNLPSFSEIIADVVVVNTYFSSNSSNQVNFTTPEGVPSMVSYFLALHRGSTHLLLEWGPPTEPNGVVTGYEVGYQKIEGFRLGDSEIAEQIDDPKTRRIFLGGLEEDSTYRVFVYGLTKQGNGEPYYIDVRTADINEELARPEILDVMAASDSVNVSWRLPDRKEQRVGDFYYLQYRKMGDSQYKRVIEDEHLNFWQMIDGLEGGTQYEVRVVTVSGSTQESSEKRTFVTGGVAAKRSSVLSAGWFIGMMVAIAILLLILIIVCIIKRNRGDKYHVQEKERLRGCNPEEGTDHFNDDNNGIGQSGSFDNNPEKMPLGPYDADSLEEYGDVDPSRFNEDGSFIGQYGDQKVEPIDTPNPSGLSAL
ncbi:neuroglian-like isoform X2 [Gigantopelta aegis]|uniref:neuroglian-like isoform X2 n=1 Tax=Gigantopelta aegis TaxID=1735272 RepID=UPI001B88C085|nr:neuroglian-like isoform X2 [Gigantopelta aegis]